MPVQFEDGRLFERHTVKSFAYVMHLAAKKSSEDMLVMASGLPFWETIKVIRSRASELAAEIHAIEKREANRVEQAKPGRNAYARRFHSERYASDPKFKLECCIRAHIRHALRKVGAKKTARSFEALGYTAQELKDHITSLLQPGMTWENHGTVWHIDHKRPVSWFKFDADNPSEFIAECWALENLQPLSARENLSKQARYEHA